MYAFIAAIHKNPPPTSIHPIAAEENQIPTATEKISNPNTKGTTTASLIAVLVLCFVFPAVSL